MCSLILLRTAKGDSHGCLFPSYLDLHTLKSETGFSPLPVIPIQITALRQCCNPNNSYRYGSVLCCLSNWEGIILASAFTALFPKVWVDIAKKLTSLWAGFLWELSSLWFALVLLLTRGKQKQGHTTVPCFWLRKMLKQWGLNSLLPFLAVSTELLVVRGSWLPSLHQEEDLALLRSTIFASFP